MRNEYSLAVKSIFKDIFKKNKSRFSLYKNKDKSILGGDLVYTMKNKNLSCCLILAPHHKEEKFTLELGWSESHDFPLVNMRPSGFLSTERKEILLSDFVFRI
jgi:hypothetical protein